MRLKTPILLSIILLSLIFSPAVNAQNADDLKAKIEDRNAQIKKLEEEIRQYNLEVENAEKQAKTLQGTIKTLDLTKKKITTDITLTERKIDKATLTIGQLDTEIDKTEGQIDVNTAAVMSALQNMQELEDIGVFELLLANKDLSELWGDLDTVRTVRNAVRNKSLELATLKSGMETKQTSLQQQKTTLTGLKQDLSGKKQAVESTTQEKASLLAQTKNKEEAFRQLVQTKEQQKEQFERELFEFESKLNLTIDKGSYPAPRSGILAWPLDTVYVTQRFGKTVGAEKLYTSGSHNGVDFRASTGTRIKNVLDGVVVGTGNTDIYPGCYSFGKWVMVKHPNGLSTIYAHLSVISVSIGQNLKTGDVIGYSGNTGYSTGPHLHVSVYATQGVRIEKYVQSRGCKQATMPLADVKAYLDPLSYFPRI